MSNHCKICGNIVCEDACKIEALEAKNEELEKKLEIAVEALEFLFKEAESHDHGFVAEQALAAINGEGV